MSATYQHNLKIFTSAMKWIYQLERCPLTQYDMVKVHVLADFDHILKYGEPLIGGQPEAWPLGPVVHDSYVQAMKWADTGGHFSEIQKRSNNIRDMVPNDAFNDSDANTLTPEGIKSLDAAWRIHSPMDFDASYEYFHTEISHFGRAWLAANARGERSPIDWCDLIDLYDNINGTDNSHIKTLLNAPSNNRLLELAKANPVPKSYWTGDSY